MPNAPSARSGPSSSPRRCLIVERHPWETGAYAHQLQFPLQAARSFFGADALDVQITIRMFDRATTATPILTKPMTISRRYGASATRRTNRVPEIGEIPAAMVFFEETTSAGVYDLWWDIDKAIVVAHLHPWNQARSNQHGRGRLWRVVNAPVLRRIRRV